MKRMTKAKYYAFEKSINQKGLPSPRQARIIMRVRRFLKTHLNSEHLDSIQFKEPYQLTFAEFKSAFAKSAITICKYDPKLALTFLKEQYINVIVSALWQKQNNISEDGIEYVRFGSDNESLVASYYKREKGR